MGIPDDPVPDKNTTIAVIYNRGDINEINTWWQHYNGMLFFQRFLSLMQIMHKAFST